MKQGLTLKALTLFVAFSAISSVASAANVNAGSGSTSSAASVQEGTVRITGGVFKHNESSEMKFNLNVMGDKGAGYVVVGGTQQQYQGGNQDNAMVKFDSLSFFKVGPQSSKGDLTIDAKSQTYSREGNIYGSLDIKGREYGNRIFNSELAGVKIGGSVVVDSKFAFSGKSDFIKFDGLMVGGKPSAGMMRFYYNDDYSGYYPMDGLSFGQYKIMGLTPDEDDEMRMIVYDQAGDFYDLNFVFGSLVVKGRIQFRAIDETRYRQAFVTKQTDSAKLLNQAILDKMLAGNNSFAKDLADARIAMAEVGVALEGSTKRVQTTVSETLTVANEADYDLTVTRQGDVLSIAADVDQDASGEAEIRALIAFLQAIVYDTYAD